MTNSELEEALRPLIERYGIDGFRARLMEVLEGGPSAVGLSDREGRYASSTKERSKKKNAKQYVASMELSEQRKALLSILAERFEEGTFLPTIGDIKNFFYIHKADPSQMKSRQASVSKVFFFLSSLPTEKIEMIVNEKMFSGPSKLGPIAEAIKMHAASIVK